MSRYPLSSKINNTMFRDTQTLEVAGQYVVIYLVHCFRVCTYTSCFEYLRHILLDFEEPAQGLVEDFLREQQLIPRIDRRYHRKFEQVGESSCVVMQ